MKKTIDLVQPVLGLLLFLLILTGGLTGKVELSQVNLFGILFGIICFYRRRKFKSFFSPSIEKMILWCSKIVSKHPNSSFLIVGIIHLFIFTLASSFRYLHFQTSAFDLSFVDQPVWALASEGFHLPFLHSTISRGGTYFGEHFSPVLALLSPGVFLSPSQPVGLFFMQSFIVVVSAFLIKRISDFYKLSFAASLFLFVLYLSLPSIRSANLFDPREDLFFLVFILLYFLFLLKNNFVMMVLSFLGLFFVKENGGIAAFACAISSVTLVSKKQRWKFFLLLAIAGLGFLFVNFVLMPKLVVSTSDNVFSNRLGLLGYQANGHFSEKFFNIFLVVKTFFKNKFNVQTLKYSALIFLPFIRVIPYLYRAQKGLLAAIVLLHFSNLFISPQRIGFHYECILIPFLMFGFFLLIQKSNPKKELTWFVLLLLCVYGRSPVTAVTKNWPTQEDRCLENKLQTIDREFAVATAFGLHPHLDRRRFIYALNEFKKSELIVLSFLPHIDSYATPNLFDFEEKLRAATSFKLFYQDRFLRIWAKKPVLDEPRTMYLKEKLISICN